MKRLCFSCKCGELVKFKYPEVQGYMVKLEIIKLNFHLFSHTPPPSCFPQSSCMLKNLLKVCCGFLILMYDKLSIEAFAGVPINHTVTFFFSNILKSLSARKQQ